VSGGSSGRDELRVGHRDREEAVRALGDHFSAGRLNLDEYERRVEQAVSARTVGDLRALFVDLPPPYPTLISPPPPPPLFPATIGPYPSGNVTVWSDKSRIVAGILQIIPGFGLGRFYTGHRGMALTQLFVVLVTCGVGQVWPMIDGIVTLINGGTDSDGRPLRD